MARPGVRKRPSKTLGVPPGLSGTAQRGCPPDKDKDGILDAGDKCPEAGSAVRPAGHQHAGCPKLGVTWYGRHATSMKDLLKYGVDVNFICGGACKIKATLAFDAATTKKLKLKSSVIDTIRDSAKGVANSQCTSCYMFNRISVPASLKKKVAKLKTATLLLTVDLTDTTLGEKSKWGSKLVVGDKKAPANLAEL